MDRDELGGDIGVEEWGSSGEDGAGWRGSTGEDGVGWGREGLGIKGSKL